MCQHGLHKEIISTNKAPKAIGTYSQAIQAGGFVYTSGQLPIDPQTNEMVNGDIKLQTERVLENLKNLLIEAGSSMDNVIKTTVFIRDMKQFPEINEVYGRYFKEHLPARSCIEVSSLPKGAGIEIEAVGIVHD